MALTKCDTCSASIWLICACFAIGGCSTMSGAERAQLQQELQANRPTCRGKAQCEAMWDAARDWVVSNCAMKIQTITDSYIDTYNPPPYSPSIACEVTKDPRPSGGYELHMRVWCNNIFGCQPTWASSLQAFEASVNATTARFDRRQTAH